MLGERIASQSEVIRAIVSGYSPCCGVPAPAVLRARADEQVEISAGPLLKPLGQQLLAHPEVIRAI